MVAPLVGTAALGTDEAATYAAALALATAVVYIALGLLRMGWISTFLSKAVMSGFTLGFAIGIVINQSALAARRPRGRRLVHAAALGNDQGDP